VAQKSITELPEAQQTAALSDTQRASRDEPSVLVEGALVHVCEMSGDYEVWINCEDADFTGLCIAAAPFRYEAIAEAVKTLRAIVRHLEDLP